MTSDQGVWLTDLTFHSQVDKPQNAAMASCAQSGPRWPAAAAAAIALSASAASAYLGSPAWLTSVALLLAVASGWRVARHQSRLVRFISYLLVVGAFLAVGTAWLPSPVSEAVIPAVNVDTEIAELLIRADAGRRLGSRDAPYHLELALSLECSHCAEAWSTLRPKLLSAIEDGRLELVVRHVVHPRAPASTALVCWAFAAAARSHAHYDRYLRAMIGTRGDVPPDQILNGPCATAAGLPGLAADVRAHARAFETLVAGDIKRMNALGMGAATPEAILLDRTGRAVGHWVGASLNPNAILMVLGETMNKTASIATRPTP